MYSLEFSKHSVKQLKKLDLTTRKRIVKVLERCRIRPHAYVKKLVGNPYFHLRVGNYRVILDIKENKLLILVLELGHRKNVYKK